MRARGPGSLVARRGAVRGGAALALVQLACGSSRRARARAPSPSVEETSLRRFPPPAACPWRTLRKEQRKMAARGRAAPGRALHSVALLAEARAR
eukprot:scaffold2471_cov215-Prasinococcus_capsulatus_cf.AAC.1